MSSGNDSNQFPPGEGNVPPPVGGDGGVDTQLNTGRPAVAAAPGKLMFVLLFAAIFIFIIVRSLFFGPKQEVKETPHGKERVVSSKASNDNEISIGPGSLPTPPSELTNPALNTSTPPPPPLPPPPPIVPTLSNDNLGRVNGANNEAYSKRVHSPIFASGGINRAPTKNGRKSAIAGGNDPNSAFADNIADTRAQAATASRVDNLDFTIVQGKLIHAVLESAIDSQLPGPIRGIVSHDVYAEAGKEILIPKGSRLIGVYNAAVKRGQVRVFIIWQRVVRPDGVDIFIESPGADSLGRAGMAGDVDNKYFEQFSTAVMVSSMSIGVAAIGEALFGDQQQTTSNNGGGTTTTSSPTTTAMQTAVSNMGTLGQSILGGVLNLSPEIFIDQGTPLNVFVNRDLLFPRDITGAGGGGFIE